MVIFKNSLCHEWHVDCLPVELCGKLCGLSNVPAVHQPESRRDGRREVDAVLDERERRGAGHVLPLSAGGAACKGNNKPGRKSGGRKGGRGHSIWRRKAWQQN
jgi:hypothetical protein